MRQKNKLQKLAEIIEEYQASSYIDMYDLEERITQNIPEGDLSDFIVKLLLNKRDEIQADVLRILAKCGHREILNFIPPLLKSSDSFVKLYTATALAHLGEKKGFKLLEEIAKKNKSKQQQTADYIPIDWILENLEDIDSEDARELKAKLLCS